MDKDHWNESVPLQHYTSCKHSLSSPHINGANTNTEPTFLHHPHTAASFHKSVTCSPTIGHPTQMCRIDPDDPQHHGDQPHQQGLHQHGLNRLLQRCLTLHQNRHHLTNLNSSRTRDGAPAIALQHLHPGPQQRHHHRQHNRKMMCGRLFTHQYNPVTSSTTVRIDDLEEEDSDGLVLPGPNLQLHQQEDSAPPPPEPEFRLQPLLSLLWPTRRTTTQSQSQDQTTHTTSHMFRTCSYVTLTPRHLVTSILPPLTTPFGSCPATSYIRSTIAHHNIQSNKPWHHGVLFTRMDFRDATNRHTHYEQSLTVPFATNTSSPELAIIRWLMHQRITHERQRVTHDYFTDLQRNRTLQPGSYFNAVARDWITTAADIYRATRGPNSPARTTFRSMAQTILDLINDTTQPEERYMVTDNNITIDGNTGRLIFVEQWTTGQDPVLRDVDTVLVSHSLFWRYHNTLCDR